MDTAALTAAMQQIADTLTAIQAQGLGGGPPPPPPPPPPPLPPPAAVYDLFDNITPFDMASHHLGP